MKKMNLQRLEEVRNNLNNLASIATIIGPQDDVVAEVQNQIGRIVALRIMFFEPVPVVDDPPAPPPIARVIQPVYDLAAWAVLEVRRQLKRISDFRTSFFPTKIESESPKPKSEPRRTLHNHITRDIKPRGQCPGCDQHHENVQKRLAVQVRPPQQKFEMPSPPAPSRKVSPALTYNPERYVPYKVLWAKVIIRAAYDYALWKDSKDLRLKKFAQDAERWLFESSDVELSFENICFSYGFPIERIRQRTRALTKQDVKKLEFRERHGRVDPGALTSGDDE